MIPKDVSGYHIGGPVTLEIDSRNAHGQDHDREDRQQRNQEFLVKPVVDSQEAPEAEEDGAAKGMPAGEAGPRGRFEGSGSRDHLAKGKIPKKGYGADDPADNGEGLGLTAQT